MKQRQTRKSLTERTAPSIKEILNTLFGILVAAPLIILSPIFIIFDGFCSGGSFCSRPPGIIAFLGSAVFALGIQLIVIAIRENILKREIKSQDWFLFSVITIGVFLFRVVIYYI